MKTKKSFLTIAGFTTLILLGACNGNWQNEHGDHDLDHHEDKEEAQGAHNHSMTEEHHGEMERDQVMHRQHESIRDNFAHKDIIILDNPYQASDAVNQELKEVINAYLEMKNALVNDDVAATNQAASIMAGKVKVVQGGTLKNVGQEVWQQHSSLYLDKLAEMQHIKGLENKRSYFSHISEIVYCSIKSFGLKDEMKLYATYCPMAFDNKGAYWISETREIKNPYMGTKMKNCGEIKEEL